MALDKDTLKTNLLTIFNTMDSSASGTPKDNAWLADQLATVIDTFIKTAQLNITNLPVPGTGLIGYSGFAIQGSATGAGTNVGNLT